MALYVNKVSDGFVRKLAYNYLEPYVTMASLAKKHNSSANTISNILYKGIAEGILDDITAQAVAKKAIDSADDVYKTKRRWEQAKFERKTAEAVAELNFLERKLEELRFQYDSYDDFVSDADCCSKESLLDSIYQLEIDIENLKSYIKSQN